MKIKKLREIVIEFERVQVIRKRATTHLLRCRMCRQETDFITLIEASKLFGTDIDKLFAFIKTNQIHFEIVAEGEIFVCLYSLLKQMKAITNLSNIKLLEE